MTARMYVIAVYPDMGKMDRILVDVVPYTGGWNPLPYTSTIEATFFPELPYDGQIFEVTMKPWSEPDVPKSRGTS